MQCLSWFRHVVVSVSFDNIVVACYFQENPTNSEKHLNPFFINLLIT